jgi:hypothetical protein
MQRSRRQGCKGAGGKDAKGQGGKDAKEQGGKEVSREVAFKFSKSIRPSPGGRTPFGVSIMLADSRAHYSWPRVQV